MLPPFLTAWVGQAMAARASLVGEVLIISVWLRGQSSLLGMFMMAHSEQKRLTSVSLVLLPAFVLGLWLGIRYFGILGAAVVVDVRALIEFGMFLLIARMPSGRIMLHMMMHMLFLVTALILLQAMNSLIVQCTVAIALVILNVVASLILLPQARKAFMRKGRSAWRMRSNHASS